MPKIPPIKKQETFKNPSSTETVLGGCEQKEKKVWKRKERRERNESGSYLDIGLLVEQALGCCRRGERKRKHQHAGMGATVNITGALMVLGQTCHITVRTSRGNPSRPTSRGLQPSNTLRVERMSAHTSRVCTVRPTVKPARINHQIWPKHPVPVSDCHAHAGDALVHMQKSAITHTHTFTWLNEDTALTSVLYHTN